MSCASLSRFSFPQFAAGTPINIVSRNHIRGSGGKAISLAGDDYEISGNDVDGATANAGARNDVFDNTMR